MSKIFILVFLLPLFLFSQTDSVTVGGKTYSGKIKKIYSDRFVFRTQDDVEYLVLKDRLDALKVRDQVVIKGQAAYQYVTDVDYVFSGDHPEFKDQKYYLREAGWNGITAACGIVGGGILAGVGTLLNRNDLGGDDFITAGSIIAGIGTAMLIPTFVFVLKSGKVKSYRTL